MSAIRALEGLATRPSCHTLPNALEILRETKCFSLAIERGRPTVRREPEDHQWDVAVGICIEDRSAFVFEI